MAIPVGYRWGTLWGFLFMAALGNAGTVCGYRQAIRRQTPQIRQV